MGGFRDSPISSFGLSLGVMVEDLFRVGLGILPSRVESSSLRTVEAIELIDYHEDQLV